MDFDIKSAALYYQLVSEDLDFTVNMFCLIDNISILINNTDMTRSASAQIRFLMAFGRESVTRAACRLCSVDFIPDG
jgi:hypothetical protein